MNWLKKLLGIQTSIIEDHQYEDLNIDDSRFDDIHSLIEQLRQDASNHEKVRTPATTEQISKFEHTTGFSFPVAYRTFVAKFGNGAYWLYGSQPLDSIENPLWLIDLRRGLPDIIAIDEGGEAKRDTLLCFMAEDSNGGSWCWLTDMASDNGQCPIAYFSDGALYYLLPSFEDWLRILVTTKTEVIRALDYDKADKLSLG